MHMHVNNKRVKCIQEVELREMWKGFKGYGSGEESDQAVIRWLLLNTNQTAAERVEEAFLSQVIGQQVRKRGTFKHPSALWPGRQQRWDREHPGRMTKEVPGLHRWRGKAEHRHIRSARDTASLAHGRHGDNMQTGSSSPRKHTHTACIQSVACYSEDLTTKVKWEGKERI